MEKDDLVGKRIWIDRWGRKLKATVYKKNESNYSASWVNPKTNRPEIGIIPFTEAEQAPRCDG